MLIEDWGNFCQHLKFQKIFVQPHHVRSAQNASMMFMKLLSIVYGQ